MDIIKSNVHVRDSVKRRRIKLDLIRKEIRSKNEHEGGFGIAIKYGIDINEVADVIRDEIKKIDNTCEYRRKGIDKYGKEEDYIRDGYYVLYIGFIKKSGTNVSRVLMLQTEYSTKIPMLIGSEFEEFDTTTMLTLEVNDINEIKRGAKND